MITYNDQLCKLALKPYFIYTEIALSCFIVRPDLVLILKYILSLASKDHDSIILLFSDKTSLPYVYNRLILILLFSQNKPYIVLIFMFKEIFNYTKQTSLKTR